MVLNAFGKEFKPLQLSDRAELEPFLGRFPQPLSGYTFAGLFAWAEAFCYSYHRLSAEALLWACVYPCDNGMNLVQPMGRLSEAEQRWLVHAVASHPTPLSMHGVGDVFLEWHPWLAAHVRVEEDRNRFDYIYDAKALATLEGRDFIKKRNLISQATTHTAWQVEPLSEANLETCVALAVAARAEMPDDESSSFRLENLALERTLQNFQALAQQGILLRMDGKPAALSIFERQTADTAVIHFERGLRSFNGAYQLVNREAAKVLWAQGYSYINREDDVGVEGLRKAKLSYRPHHLERSYVLHFDDKTT